MKRVYKLIKKIGRYYGNYDLHVTKNHIEVKFSPISNSLNVSKNRIQSDEVVFVTSLSTSTIGSFELNLEEHLNKIESQSQYIN